MTTVNLFAPNPQTLHLSAGDALCSITYEAVISDPAENPATFVLEIIDDQDVVFANGKSSVSWTVNNLTKALTTQPAQPQTFHLAGTVNETTPAALKLTATDKSGLPTDSNTHIIYF
jgi:hypothetical protein